MGLLEVFDFEPGVEPVEGLREGWMDGGGGRCCQGNWAGAFSLSGQDLAWSGLTETPRQYIVGGWAKTRSEPIGSLGAIEEEQGVVATQPMKAG